MCGRFTQTASAPELARAFGVAEVPPVKPRYNIAPTQDILTVRGTPDGREALYLKWGLVPSWAKDVAIASRLINARSETVESKPSFRDAFKRRRCLIVADGFYEWDKKGDGKKQPYYLSLRDGRPFAFAGLWERWQSPDGKPLDTCTILTTTANHALAPIHDRMPVILHPADHDLWLTAGERQSDELQALLAPYPAEEMTSHPVSPLVNSPSQQGAELLQPVPLNSL